MWNVITMKLCPGSMGLRHFIPLLFVLSIIVLSGAGFFHWIFWGALAFELLLYFAISIAFSFKKGKGIKEKLLLFILFPIFHVSYGIGSLFGIFKLFSKKHRRKYTPKSI